MAVCHDMYKILLNYLLMYRSIVLLSTNVYAHVHICVYVYLYYMYVCIYDGIHTKYTYMHTYM